MGFSSHSSLLPFLEALSTFAFRLTGQPVTEPLLDIQEL